MTIANNILVTFFVSLAVLFSGVTAADYTPTREIISNEMFRVAGSGDTLWIVSSKGVNFSTSMLDSPVVWRGFNNVNGYSALMSGGYALICLWPSGSAPNDLWLYNHQSAQHTRATLPYQTGAFDTLQGGKNRFAFYAIDAIRRGNAFWVACMDGGLTKIDSEGRVTAIFHPGTNAAAFSFSTYTPKDLGLDSLDRAKRAIAVAAHDTLIYTACERALWRFNPADTTWERLADPANAFSEYTGIAAYRFADTSFLLATVSHIQTDTVYRLFSCNCETGRWQQAGPETFRSLPSIATGAGGYLYVVNHTSNDIALYRITRTDDVAVQRNYDFLSRIRRAGNDIVNFSINDIAYAVRGSDTLFYVATDIGLFYSTNEHAHEIDSVPFTHISRKVPLAADLGKTYAVPGIINNYHPAAFFAYNLGRDDRVSIDIFDYNMDHVITIIDNAPRKAGKNRTSGRSTELLQDRWDGTINGKPVPPGVYFYRIKTGEGKRAFGKIIVAKN